MILATNPHWLLTDGRWLLSIFTGPVKILLRDKKCKESNQSDLMPRSVPARFDTPEHPLFSSLAPGGNSVFIIFNIILIIIIIVLIISVISIVDLRCTQRRLLPRERSRGDQSTGFHTNFPFFFGEISQFSNALKIFSGTQATCFHTSFLFILREMLLTSQMSWKYFQGPRQPWQDIHCQLKGSVALDVAINFSERFLLYIFCS